jgi:hypothetical protein
MKNLFTETDTREILDRLDRITPQSTREWGKMSVSKMLAHCSESMETATGNKHYPRVFIGRIFGPLARRSFFRDKPMPKGAPTDKHFIIVDEPEFYAQKQRLTGLIRSFAAGGPENASKYPHSFFGKLTPEEWGKLMYKHLDHHFRQFGG